MKRTIPIIIANNNLLIKDIENDKFVVFEMPGLKNYPNIPFFHQFAGRISQCQYYFKEFMVGLYGKKVSKSILAIVTPDDTTALERIFINEFFVNSGACKAVAQITMGQTLSKEHTRYISISRSCRNVVLQYIASNEVMAERYYDIDTYNASQIKEDAKRIHIDVEYSAAPIYINNFNMNMDDFLDTGIVISTKDFLDKISEVDVEKV